MQRIMQIYQVCETTLFLEKKKPTLPEQDIDMKTELECRIQEWDII